MITGKQTGIVIKTEYGHSEQKGTPRFRVYFEVENMIDGTREAIHGDIYLTDKAMGMARKSLKALGFDPDKQDLDALVSNPNLLTGNKATLDIQEEHDQKGNPRLKVAFINPLPKPPEKDELKKLSQALRDVKKVEAVAVEEHDYENPPF